MARAPATIDVSSIPALARLAREVAEDGQPRVLTADGAELAVLSPVHPSRRAHDADLLEELERRRRRGLNWAEMTAGILKPYAKSPAPTPREEKNAFEQGVASQVMESMRE